ncbi:prephenate dehydrogenase (NADP(+)) [Boothiomyces sp. JEL0866]|nr:prephenate dehydrogenase (NADP(+)) [Boothiomyces sp. JEL0866]
MTKKNKLELGIIGFGDMGKLYGKYFLKAGWKNVNVCDLPENYEKIKPLEKQGFKVWKDGYAVARRCDFVMFSVEAAYIDKVVGQFGPSMRIGSIACGQTSVKDPEINAFEKYLPDDVNIVTCHSLHGPSVNPKNQPLVIIRHRSNNSSFDTAVEILESLESKIVHLTAKEHDHITADTQAVTHLAFLSMGTAWKTNTIFPWENAQYTGGIENAKTLMALRIYGNKWHVYAGLVLLNPYAFGQVQQYAQSVSDLFKLMIQEKEKEFRERVYKARDFVFQGFERNPILLSDSLLDQFSLGAVPKTERKPNSHLSLLAIVDCWERLGIRPYDHLICQTPPFRLLLGIAEYLFRNEEFLEEAIHAALFVRDIRADDCEFYTSAKGWVECIELASMEAYQKRFESTSKFFRDRVPHASKVKALAVIDNDTFASASRDSNVIIWKRSGSTWNQQATFTKHNHFVNALAYIPPLNGRGLLASGGSDKLIYVFDPSNPENVKYKLEGHSDNICTLAVSPEGDLISGSWDKTAKVWRNGKCISTLAGHVFAVWGVLAVGEGTFLTASADKTIKIWNNGMEIRTIKGHSDVVRSLINIPNIGIASTSNDGTIRVVKNNGELVYELHGHNSFVYGLARLPSGDLVSSGEDRTVRIWKGKAEFQCLIQPCVSVWSVAVADSGDIFAAGSDGFVRVFTQSSDRVASAEELQAYEESLSASSIPSNQVGDIKKDDLPGPEALDQPGSKEGQIKMVRVGNVVEAYQWSGSKGTWEKVGEVVDAVGNKRKQVYLGKEYDYVFDVEIQPGAPHLKLPYNSSDNPYMAAQDFINANELSQDFLEEIANFIITNAQDVTLGEAPNSGYADPLTGGNRYVPGGGAPAPRGPSIRRGDPFTGTSRHVPPDTKPTSDLVPMREYAFFKTANFKALLTKIEQFNQESVSRVLSSTELISLKNLVDSVEKGTVSKTYSSTDAELLNTLIFIWPEDKRFPGIDLLRLIVLQTPKVVEYAPIIMDSLWNSLGDLSSSTLAKQTETNLMLVLRTYANSFAHSDIAKQMFAAKELIVGRVKHLSEQTSNKNLHLALASLFLNLSVLYAKQPKNEIFAVDLLEASLTLLKVANDNETVLRIIVSLGTLLNGSPELNETAALMGWCGSSSDYCGAGCQPLYGRCGGAPIPKPPTHTTTKKPTVKTTTKPAPSKTATKNPTVKTTSKAVATKTVTKTTSTKSHTATHTTAPTAVPQSQGQMFSPYCDVLMYPTIDIASIQQAIGLNHFTLAFIGSDAFGNPAWGNQVLVDKSNLYFIDQINAVRAAGGDVTIGFGGANIVELAVVTSDPVQLAAKYQLVIDLYKAKSIDFDIEGDVVTNAPANDVRSQAIKILKQNNPSLIVSATLPCTPFGLIASGIQVLTSAAKYGAHYDVLNCMAFDFGSYYAPQGMTQMASYAIQAAKAIYSQGKSSGLSNFKAGVTIMIGNDDVLGEVFSLANGAQLIQFAQQNPWLGLLSFWSLNRDNGNNGPLWASSGISQTQFEFSKMFNVLNTGNIQLFENVFAPVTTRDQERPTSTTGIAAEVTTILNNIKKLHRSQKPDQSTDVTKINHKKTKTFEHVGMGADIYKEYASARQVIDECEEALGLRLKNIMFEGPQNVLTSTINAQPGSFGINSAILCHSIALLRVLEEDFGFDIKKCTYAMGHSLGEYSALVATGAISLVDAIRLVRLRGEAMQKSVNNKATAMRALIVTGDHLDAIEELMPRLTRSLPGEVAEIANINSRTQIVLSGTEKGVEYAASVFHSKGYTGRSLPLPVSAPFHCSLMEPAAEIMGPALDSISFKEPKIEVISNVTAKPFVSPEEISKLLKKQIVQTVNWQRCIQYAKDDFVFDWVVVGPSRVLSNLVKKEYPHDSIRSVSVLQDIRAFDWK